MIAEVETVDSVVASFVVPGIPVAQPRQRHRILTAGGRSFAQNYTPTRSPVNEFKAAVRMAWSGAYSGAPLEGPLGMLLVFVMPRPKAMQWKKRPMPRDWYAVSKNDWDNLGKSVSDALLGLAYADDGQIAMAQVNRVIASGDEAPHTKVTVMRLGELA